MSLMRKILITGFEAFGGDSMNYSLMAVAQSNVDCSVIRASLPVGFDESYARCDEIVREYDDVNTVILVGQAASRERVTIEKIGINWQQAGIPDNFGKQPEGSRLENDGPDGIFTRTDINSLVSYLKDRGCDVGISYSAGSYVCNSLYYRMLYFHPEMEIIFIHVPAKDIEKSISVIEKTVDYYNEH